jgi:putative intracellular protease/amidase
MYGVPENKHIQRITMTIYEKYNGIVSSVCHGTAGIVNLKTQDGEFLVKGKRISGYPDAYENQSKAYFKQFPFLIQQTIESRGGQFFYSPRNNAHVEVDERIVTGQNHLSSSLVAEKMIQILQKTVTTH